MSLPELVNGVTSYSDLATADQWFAARHLTRWQQAENMARVAALITAADWLDGRFQFAGKRARDDQPRAWPRRGFADKNAVTGLPGPVQHAYFILALALLDGEGEGANMLGFGGQILNERIGNVSVRYAPSTGGTRITALLAPYLRTTNACTLVRT